MALGVDSVQITVEYAAQIKRVAGTGEEQVEVPADSTLHDLFAVLADRHGAALRELLFDPAGATRKSILVFVDDAQVVGIPTRDLQEGSRVTIMTPISGG